MNETQTKAPFLTVGRFCSGVNCVTMLTLVASFHHYPVTDNDIWLGSSKSSHIQL